MNTHDNIADLSSKDISVEAGCSIKIWNGYSNMIETTKLPILRNGVVRERDTRSQSRCTHTPTNLDIE